MVCTSFSTHFEVSKPQNSSLQDAITGLHKPASLSANLGVQPDTTKIPICHLEDPQEPHRLLTSSLLEIHPELRLSTSTCRNGASLTSNQRSSAWRQPRSSSQRRVHN